MVMSVRSAEMTKYAANCMLATKRIKNELKAPIIFDGRNLYSPKFLGEMGFAYFSIGRPGVIKDVASDLPGPGVQERMDVEQVMGRSV